MYKEKKVAVVIPAFNEQKLIGRVLSTLPAFIDKAIVVDDASSDKTSEIVKEFQQGDPRILLVHHEKNQGVGGAICSGYSRVLQEGSDIAVVVAGDGQMNPDDMAALLEPVAAGQADYCKGNRLFRGESWKMIPHYRYLGNAFLSLLTKFASGYWHISDSQCGYTAISAAALKGLNLAAVYKRYGMPNDFLIKLNIANFRVKDVPVQPIYGIGERSGIKLSKVIPAISLLLARGFFSRLWQKYVIKDFHPLVFFYALSFLLLCLSVPLFVRVIYYWILFGYMPRTSALALMFSIIAGLQSLFFAMWFDMENNKSLK